MKFVCKNCGFRVEKSTAKKEKCPYCDQMSLQKEQSAEELIEESSN